MDFKTFQKDYLHIEVEEVPNLVKKDPLLSIIILTYQHAGFIENCLGAILNQRTNYDYEIILGEDASTDGTREIALQYAENFPDKIRLFLHNPINKIKINNEITGNFNAAYSFFKSRGKYIAFCEGDDIWKDSLKIQKQLSFLESHPNISFVYQAFKTINEEGVKIESPEEINQPKWDISREDLLEGKYHPLLLTICFNNVFSGIPREMVEVLNIDTFLLSYLGNYGEAKFQGEIEPSYYRKHSGGIWSQRIIEKKFLSKINTFRNLSNYYKKEKNTELYEYFKNKMIENYKMLAFYNLKVGRIFSAVKIIRLMIKE